MKLSTRTIALILTSFHTAFQPISSFSPSLIVHDTAIFRNNIVTVLSACQKDSQHQFTRAAATLILPSQLVLPRYHHPFTIITKTTLTSSVSSTLGGQSKDDNKEEESNQDRAVAKPEPLSEKELQVISSIAQQEASSLSSFLMAKLPKMPPNTILTLRSASQGDFPPNLTEEQKRDLELVGKALVEIMDEQLQAGRDLLQTLLQCGEIRKLDGAIGKAHRDGKLDMAFFTVLNLNIRDATIEALEKGESTDLSQEGEMGSGANPNRLQILQHVYTRCQEEVEKTASPGVGLLNKLLRTEQASIRSNQLKYYLCPQEPKIIKSPDGKEVQLKGSKALVPPKEFIEALQNAVKQIRTVEKTGAADKVAAAGLVENCRQVAIEARLAIGEGYGFESEELKDFEAALQPVFRPESPDSEYIQGFQSTQNR